MCGLCCFVACFILNKPANAPVVYGVIFEVNYLMEKLGFGGSCHWCTEAIFQSLIGVDKVEQGWIASEGEAADFSEAVIVTFSPDVITLETLVAVHLHTHSCTANHTMRAKYRSAVYTFNPAQGVAARLAIEDLQPEFDAPVITIVIPFKAFKLNGDQYLNYYYNNPAKPFCENIVSPKLKLLMERFAEKVKPHLNKLNAV